MMTEVRPGQVREIVEIQQERLPHEPFRMSFLVLDEPWVAPGPNGISVRLVNVYENDGRVTTVNADILGSRTRFVEMI